MKLGGGRLPTLRRRCRLGSSAKSGAASYDAAVPQPASVVRGLERLALRARTFSEAGTTVLGFHFDVPDGAYHPALDGASAFFHRVVGPMIAPGQRVLDAGTGVGVGAVVAASRGASVVAVDCFAPAVRAASRNIAAAGLHDSVELRTGDVLDVVPEGGFHLVLWNGPQDPRECRGDRCFATKAGSDLARFTEIVRAAPRWIGERGRLIVLTDALFSTATTLTAAVPEGHRLVPLSRSPLGRFTVWSMGLDLERARAERQGADTRTQRRARVSRRRWQAGETDAPDTA